MLSFLTTFIHTIVPIQCFTAPVCCYPLYKWTRSSQYKVQDPTCVIISESMRHRIFCLHRRTRSRSTPGNPFVLAALSGRVGLFVNDSWYYFTRNIQPTDRSPAGQQQTDHYARLSLVMINEHVVVLRRLLRSVAMQSCARPNIR